MWVKAKSSQTTNCVEMWRKGTGSGEGNCVEVNYRKHKRAKFLAWVIESFKTHNEVIDIAQVEGCNLVHVRDSKQVADDGTYVGVIHDYERSTWAELLKFIKDTRKRRSFESKEKEWEFQELTLIHQDDEEGIEEFVFRNFNSMYELYYTRDEWDAFVEGVKNKEFELE